MPDFDKPLNRILIVNDDGLSADGLACLEQCAGQIGNDVWTVAPDCDRSGSSRAITLGAPLRVRTESPRRFAVDGTPADCVVVALQSLMSDAKPDLVLSGINHGANIADDVSLSGTIGAAIEARSQGIPAMAISSAFNPKGRRQIDWQRLSLRLPDLLAQLWPPLCDERHGAMIFNVNFPSQSTATLDRVQVTRLSPPRIRKNIIKCTDPRNENYYWLTFDNEEYPADLGDRDGITDIAALQRGVISVTPLHLDHYFTMEVDSDMLSHLEAAIGTGSALKS